MCIWGSNFDLSRRIKESLGAIDIEIGVYRRIADTNEINFHGMERTRRTTTHRFIALVVAVSGFSVRVGKSTI